MKVVITHMKAPWPAGAAIGQVVEVGESVPGCFVGKCRPAGDGEEAAHAYEPPEAPDPEVPRDLAAELTEAKAALVGERATVAELRAKLTEAEAALAARPAGKTGKP